MNIAYKKRKINVKGVCDQRDLKLQAVMKISESTSSVLSNLHSSRPRERSEYKTVR